MIAWKYAVTGLLIIALLGCSDEGDLNSELEDGDNASDLEPDSSHASDSGGNAEGTTNSSFELFNDTGLVALEEAVLQASQPAGLDRVNRAASGAIVWVANQLGEQDLADSRTTPARLGCAEGGRMDVQAALNANRGDTWRMTFEACGLDGRIINGQVVSTDSSRDDTVVIQHDYTDFRVDEGADNVAVTGSSSRDYQLETQEPALGGATEQADISSLEMLINGVRTRYTDLTLFNKLFFTLQRTDGYIGYRRDIELQAEVEAPPPVDQMIVIRMTIPFRQYGAEPTRGRLRASLPNGDTLTVETTGSCLSEALVTRSSTDGATLSDTVAWDSPRNLLGAIPQPRFQDDPVYTFAQSPCSTAN